MFEWEPELPREEGNSFKQLDIKSEEQKAIVGKHPDEFITTQKLGY